jgi:hypothetical protein
MNRFLLSLFFLVQCCSKDVVVPPTPERTPRDYAWVRDTLGDGSIQTSFTGLWASSPKDVYVVGHSSDWFDKKIWHFNGEKWEDFSSVYFQVFAGRAPQLFPFSPIGIYGFNASDIWIVGGRDTAGVGSGGGVHTSLQRSSVDRYVGPELEWAHQYLGCFCKRYLDWRE